MRTDAQIGDYLEIASIPQVVRKSAELTRPDLTFGDPPEGAMNVMPLLAEIDARMHGASSRRARLRDQFFAAADE